MKEDALDLGERVGELVDINGNELIGILDSVVEVSCAKSLE